MLEQGVGDLEVVGDEVAFASRRKVAWHSLGTVFQEDVSTSEMLRAAHLNDWDVRLMEATAPEGVRMIDPGFIVVRTNPFDGGLDGLGRVGERYHPFQNEDLLGFGDALLDGGRWETAGSIRQGRVVFAALALDHEVVIDPDGVGERIETYLMVTTSHDGTKAIQASVTPIRPECANTLNLAFRRARQTFKIRHTQSMNGKVQAAREALGLADAYLDVWTEEMTDLYRTPVSDDDFLEIINRVYEPNDTKAGVTRFEKRKDVLWDIWKGDTLTAVTGTKYGAFNALNEELGWYRNGRGANAETNMAESRSGFNPVWNAANNNLLEVVRSF